MLNLSGNEQFDQPPDAVWRSLADARFLSECFPGVDRVARADDDSATVVVRPGFSFVRGTLEVTFEFAEKRPPADAHVTVRIKGIGSSAELAGQIHVAPADGGSLVAWSIEAVALGGLLKAVSQGLMQAAAQKVAADTWARVRERFGSA